MNMRKMLLMLAMTLCAGLLTFCAVTPGLCEWAPGDPLFLEDFNDGVVGNDVTTLGWAHYPAVGPAWAISDEVIDDGNCAKLTSTAVFPNSSFYVYNMGPTQGYPGTYTLQPLEVVAMTWTTKTPGYGDPTRASATFAGIRDTALKYTRLWIYEDQFWCYTQGAGEIAIDFPEGLAEVVDLKIEFSTSGTGFFYRNHGTLEWNLIIHHDIAVPDIQQVGFYAETKSGTPMEYMPLIDTIKIEVVPTGTVSGTVTLEGYSGSKALTPVIVDVIKDGVAVGSRRVELDASGNYMVSVPAGTCDLGFVAAKCLRNVETGVEVVANQTVTRNTTLKNGDVDGDGEITSSDLSSTLVNVGQTGE